MNTFDNLTLTGKVTAGAAASAANDLIRLGEAQALLAALFQGTWQSGTAYTAGQMVVSNGALYAARVSSTGYAPATNPGQWAVLVASLGAAYVYVAYASDASGTDFTTTFNASLDYIAFKATNSALVSPIASDFAGLWKKVKGEPGGAGQTQLYTSTDPNADGITPADITQPGFAYKLGGNSRMFTWNTSTHVWE